MAKNPDPPVVAVVGKGGTGKTVLACLLARCLKDQGRTPLLLVDADPLGGLAGVLGQGPSASLALIAERLVAQAGQADADASRLAQEVDWQVLQALVEGDSYSLLSLGKPEAEGCFCPVHRLLREALGQVASGYACTLVDAEAGVEQLKRRAFASISHALVVVDGSGRAARAAEQIAGALPKGTRAGLVLNRAPAESASLPAGLELLACLPEDVALAQADRQGLSLWDLPTNNPVLVAASALPAWL